MGFAESVNARREQMRLDGESARTQAEEDARLLEARRTEGERRAKIAKLLADTLLSLPDPGLEQTLAFPASHSGRYVRNGSLWRSEWVPDRAARSVDAWILKSSMRNSTTEVSRSVYVPVASYDATDLASDGSIYRVRHMWLPRTSMEDKSEPRHLTVYDSGNEIYARKLEVLDLDESIEQDLRNLAARREEIDPAIFATFE